MENKEMLEMVKGLKSQIDELNAKEEKSRSEAAEQDKLEEKLAELKSELGKELEEAKAQAKALEAKMQTPEFVSNQKDEEKSAMKAAYAKALRNGVNVLSNEEVKALRTDIDPQGGFLVDEEMASFVVDRIFETSPMRQVSRVVPTSSPVLEVLIDDDEAAARWQGEGASGGETDTPDLGKLLIHAHKIEADPRITNEMLEDSRLDIEVWLREKVADKFRRTENTAFINGDGVNKPRGILTYDAWSAAGVYQRDALEQVASGNASDLTADGIIDLQNALKEEYQANAVFMMKRETWGAVSKLKDADNNYLVDFAGRGLAVDKMQRPSLLGKPVVFADDMPSVDDGNLPVAYGDFSRGYTICDRVGISVLRDPYSNKGFVTYYTTKRTGGAVTNFDAIKLQVVSE